MRKRCSTDPAAAGMMLCRLGWSWGLVAGLAACGGGGDAAAPMPPAAAERTLATAADDGAPGVSAAALALRPGDVFGHADAVRPFAQQNWGVQCEGSSRAVATVPESGISGARLEDGTTLKFGKVADPGGSGERVLVFRSNKRNEWVAGAPRCEGMFNRAGTRLPKNEVFWVAMSVWPDDWSATIPEDGQVIQQWHDGLQFPGLRPILAMKFLSDKFSVSINHDPTTRPSSSTTIKREIYSQYGGLSRRWVNIVTQARISPRPGGGGFVKLWINGQLRATYTGPLGYYEETSPYLKFGSYKTMHPSNPWDMTIPTRTVRVRELLMVRDPDRRYTAGDLLAALRD